MNKCTEGWPNAPSDVSPDAFDAFLAHVAGCPFHEKALDEEEENIRSKFRLARGLDTHGRILAGPDLKRALKTHDHNHEFWKQVAKERKRPFKRIDLSNRGDLIAGSGKFFICRKYEGNHRLDPEAGLQLWGVIDEGKSIPDVLLGSYPLYGVRHTGEEQFLPLDNGFTAALRVEQLSEREFNIGFRCVENEVLERERIEGILNHIDNQAGSLHHTKSSRFNWLTEQVQWMGQLFRWAKAGLGSLVWSCARPFISQNKIESIACVAIVFFLGLTATLWIDLGLQLMSERSSDAGSTKVSTSTNAKPAKAEQRESRRRETIVRSDKPDKRNNANQTESSSVVPGESDSSDSVAVPNDNPPVAEPKPDANAEEAKGPVAWHFQSKPPLAVAEDGVAIHSGYDAVLGQKLRNEMRKRDISVRPFNVGSLKGNHVAVSWSIIREDTSVTVEATLTTDGESKVLSFTSAGSCPQQVCDEAVRTAVSGVFAVMRDLTHSESTNAEF